MKIHETRGTPNGRRLRVFLAEKGLDIPGEEVDLRGGGNLSAEFRARNPFARIPVLELDDGTCIAESVAISRYFEELHPTPPLFGRTPLEKATVEMWNRRAEINFLLNGANAFRNISGFFKDREEISLEWGRISEKRAAADLRLFDAHLAASQFLAGDYFSIADITLATAYDFLRRVKLDLPFDLPGVSRWYAEVSARPSFR